MSILKIAIPSLLVLAAVGCIDAAEKSDIDAVAARIDKLSAQNAQKNDMQALLYEELVKRTNGMEKKVGDMDILLTTMKAQVERLEDLAKTMRAQIEQLSKAPPSAGPAVLGTPGQEAAKALKIEDIQLEIVTVLTELRSGKLKTDEAATRLRPYAQHAAPRILQELRESIARYEYAKQLEIILARFPAAELKVPLQEGLKQRLTRESCVRVVGAVRDLELSRILEDYLAEGDEDSKLAIGDALVRCRNGSGIPLLLVSLKSEQNTTRTIAIAALKKINRGDDLGYRPQLSPEANAGPIKSWEEWSDKFAKTVFE
jgi:hypothetical protein